MGREPAGEEYYPDDEVEVLPLMGNEAIARGAWEAGVKVASAYPGTPSTEILESMANFPAKEVEAQWATNEKVAVDVAIGASFAGVRAFAAMKHVGVNVASDALMSQTYIGAHAGLVIAVCDDPGIHSSQNEQDTRLFCRLGNIPLLEPADAQEALDYTRLAFEISETFDTPVIVRSSTRLSHTRSPVRVGNRTEIDCRGFNENPQKNVMIPSHARLSHPKLIERESRVGEYFDQIDLNHWERGDQKVGIITVGTVYSYVKEVLPTASILKLASSYPLARETISDFCNSVDRVLVVEELEPVIEEGLKVMGIATEGKAFFPRVGEFSPEVVRQGLESAGVIESLAPKPLLEVEPLARPPVLCAGCPHTSSYMALRGLNARVLGDIGCYTLAAIEPLEAIDTCVAMGSSIGNAVGMAKAGTETRPLVATIGDSTFLHAGLPPLIDAVYNEVDITVLILDNSTTAMTGGQDHAATGKTLRGEQTNRVKFDELVRATGVKWVKTVDSYDLATLYQTIREAVEFKGVAVVISDRPCVLDPVKIKGQPFEIKAELCVACQSCMNLSCPALVWTDEIFDGHRKVKIDAPTCMGCSLCAQVCPTDAIRLQQRGSGNQ
ncbi:MAG: indolepyruvate ferredoxin oxidoreductase subunit alpha [Acidiferrobacteraceae bacterium]|jgi:indolepyruvate ferredoxin oxidoreductase alpha subunit|nr:indolepyruvate ferredoxin oxidoreductase subunit alpha [Acidiferrobacteraceae bacterium]MDP6434291.1 indolepyruvate ferredoxin oxidoreductase subunit alpha [Arenicellales bacterium]MDP6671780.1 indolepyruvate ferredoxin oxidoreductase subunit alpha [Arenicellales bacterium]MDP6723915.1 indolepyruvate ferredoxin oxidoreductase subunit alpha [Arenicellales bacterium]|tara:strand:+ start:86173 stop:88002 length:1830 start_codon:yes stop_codon:yes gene_type:complete